jgi:hypothetical protein
MRKNFTEVDYLERKLLIERLDVLNYRWRQVNGDQKEYYPDREFTLAEIENIASLISALRIIERVYGEK